MLLKRFYDTSLAQASYLIGCAATGEAIVVDPIRDVDQYLKAAASEGLEVTHVTETHIHADFVSGSRELARRAGARLLLSGEGGPDWAYAFAASDGALLLRDGDHFMVGNLRFDVLHTPGHTPEHLTFLVTDTPATGQPIGALTGDFVFVGDVGRPDLLEKAAKQIGTMEAGARTLFRSLQRFKKLPDHLQIWPGHGAGSACGKALGAMPSSTLGYEKIVNWGLTVENEDEFVSMVLAGQPEPPRYFAEMKRVNREGPRIRGVIPTPARLDETRLADVLAAGGVVVDTRPASAFATAHVPGTLSIPLNRSFSTWMGWLVPYDVDFHLIVDETCGDCAARAARELALIGLDRIAGYFRSSAIDAWRAAGRSVGEVPQIEPAELVSRLTSPGDDTAVVDVRGRAEWEAGHVPGVSNIPVGQLGDRLAELPRKRPLVLHCATGGRSMIAASLLRARGFTNVANLSGGYARLAQQSAFEKLATG